MYRRWCATTASARIRASSIPAGTTTACGLRRRAEGWDADRAAPRLAEARLGAAEIGLARTQLVDNLRLLVGAGFVHADLSAYNLMWWQEQLWLIDFPQAVDVTTNPHAFDYLHRDVANVGNWFARHGVSIEVDELYAELVGIACTR